MAELNTYDIIVSLERVIQTVNAIGEAEQPTSALMDTLKAELGQFVHVATNVLEREIGVERSQEMMLDFFKACLPTDSE